MLRSCFDFRTCSNKVCGPGECSSCSGLSLATMNVTGNVLLCFKLSLCCGSDIGSSVEQPCLELEEASVIHVCAVAAETPTQNSAEANPVWFWYRAPLRPTLLTMHSLSTTTRCKRSAPMRTNCSASVLKSYIARVNVLTIECAADAAIAHCTF